MSKEHYLETKELVDNLGFDIYASILADTISSIRTPANVGVFAGWGSGKSYLLRNIKYKLNEYSKGFVTTTTNVSLCFKLLFRLMFFHPPKRILDSREVRFITVHFNALEYAGTDHLWAGLVTRLVGATEAGIGRLASAIFRTKPVNILSRRTRAKTRGDKFRPKTLCGTKMPVYLVWIFVVILCLGLGAATLVYTLNKHAVLLEKNYENINSSTSYQNGTMSPEVKQSSVAVGAVFLSIPVIAFFKNFIPVLLRTIHTQKKEIRKIFSKPEFTQQLGVMAKIKGEIRHITKLVRYMELFEGRRIIVAIFIDDLDKLPQQTIAPLLQAIKILLSDPDSRFVSVIAMDPYSVAQALEMGIQSEFPSINISGHKFLKHLIQVPFCIPEMNKAEKSRLLSTLVVKNKLSQSKIHIVTEEKGPECQGEDVADGKLTDDRKPKKLLGNYLEGEEDSLLRSVKASDDLEMTIKHTTDMNDERPLDQYGDVVTACDVVLAQLRHEDICPFIKNNYQEMLRLIGIIKVTTRIIHSRLKTIKDDYFADDLAEPLGVLPSQLATWVVIVAQWPYKTTWIIQHVKDMDDDGKPYQISTPLNEVYREIQPKISLARNWKKLVKLDEDPSDMEDFLLRHKCWLNVEFLVKLLPYTISLDKSLKHIVACTSIEHDVRMHSNIPSKKLAKMDVNDIVDMISNMCGDSAHLERYKRTCREHSISGIVLLKGDISEIKKCFNMVLGDWTRFSHCFLHMKNFSNYHEF